MNAYIDKKLVSMLSVCNTLFSSNMKDNTHSITIVCNAEWDAEEFEKYLNDKMTEYVDRLTEHTNGAYEFGYEVTNVDNVLAVSIEWTTNINNPFDMVLCEDEDN